MRMAKSASPSIVVEQKVTVEDYSRAASAVRYFSAPFKRRSFRALIFITVAAVSASLVFSCRSSGFGKEKIPEAIAIISAAVAAAIWFLQPPAESRSAKRLFSSCALMSLPEKVTVYRDRVVIENSCESITEYWTDFFACVETDEMIAAAGGRKRFLVIVKKRGLAEKQLKILSSLFGYAFEGRIHRFPVRRKR
ncbi:MAG TPA: hypothetical protein DG942_06015 [Ruminococcaceae bacterium]|nr:hypothetical protein [Oscillospiraceae bacterium]